MGRSSCAIIVEFGMLRLERCQIGDGGCMLWARSKRLKTKIINISSLVRLGLVVCKAPVTSIPQTQQKYDLRPSDLILGTVMSLMP